MPRYFFNVHDGRDIIDQTGSELTDMDAVREAAVVSAGEAIRELGPSFWQDQNWELLVLDETRTRVLSLSFKGNDRPD